MFHALKQRAGPRDSRGGRLVRELQAEQARIGVLFAEGLRKLAERLDVLETD